MKKANESEMLRQFLDSLFNKVEYAIERNVDSVFQLLAGDIDMLVREKDFPLFIRMAKERDLLISIARSYGGARVFIGNNAQSIKRIDCIWRLHYRGVSILAVKEILDKRIIDPATGLFVLPEVLQARVVWGVKNAYGGADRYSPMLEQYGLKVFESRERISWLRGLVLRHPLSSISGFVRYLLTYTARIIRPTGLLVYGVPVERLRSSRAINYLFQGRVRYVESLPLAIIKSRLKSELCVIRYEWLAKLCFAADATTTDCENKIIRYLLSKNA